jgi:hypothetical protein
MQVIRCTQRDNHAPRSTHTTKYSHFTSYIPFFWPIRLSRDLRDAPIISFYDDEIVGLARDCKYLTRIRVGALGPPHRMCFALGTSGHLSQALDFIRVTSLATDAQVTSGDLVHIPGDRHALSPVPMRFDGVTEGSKLMICSWSWSWSWS